MTETGLMTPCFLFCQLSLMASEMCLRFWSSKFENTYLYLFLAQDYAIHARLNE
jgi:hypothetical protein